MKRVSQLVYPLARLFLVGLVSAVPVVGGSAPSVATTNSLVSESCEDVVPPFRDSLASHRRVPPLTPTVTGRRRTALASQELSRSIPPLALRNFAAAVALQPDGKIIVAGTAGYALALLRYNSDGSLDSAFGTGGVVTARMSTVPQSRLDSHPWHFDVVTSLTLQPDSKIIVAGSTANAAADTVESRFFVVRFTGDGHLDASFGRDGKALPYFGRGGMVLAILPGGKLLTAMGSVGKISLVRLRVDGQVDADFGSGGAVDFITQPVSFTDALLGKCLPGHKPLITGYRATPWQPELAVLRYSLQGNVASSIPVGTQPSDSSEKWPWYAQGGPWNLSANEESFFLQSVAFQADGRILAGGFVPRPDMLGEDFALTRHNGDGAVDPGFGTGGKVLPARNEPLFSENTRKGLFSDLPYACRGFCQMAVQSDGKIVAAGSPGHSGVTLFRFHPDGSRDAEFGTAGKVLTAVGSKGDILGALRLQEDGKIVAVGACGNAVHMNFLVLRYNPDGSLDPSFAGDGQVTTPVGPKIYDPFVLPVVVPLIDNVGN